VGFCVALLLVGENETKWGFTIGYFVGVELLLALSLADEYFINGVSNDIDADRAENASQLPTSCGWF
jgi:hypothetical protein